MKYKIGDRIIFTGKSSRYLKKGMAGVVTNIDVQGDPWIKQTRAVNNTSWCAAKEDLKLVKPRKVAKKKPIYYNTKYDFICSKEWCHITVKHSHVGRPRKESALSRLGQIAVPVKWFEEEVTFKITKLEDGTELIFIPTKEWSVHQTNIPKLHVLRKVKK